MPAATERDRMIVHDDTQHAEVFAPGQRHHRLVAGFGVRVRDARLQRGPDLLGVGIGLASQPKRGPIPDVRVGVGRRALAEALRALDPRYVLDGGVAPGSGQVPVLRCATGAEADTFRDATPRWPG